MISLQAGRDWALEHQPENLLNLVVEAGLCVERGNHLKVVCHAELGSEWHAVPAVAGENLPNAQHHETLGAGQEELLSTPS